MPADTVWYLEIPDPTVSALQAMNMSTLDSDEMDKTQALDRVFKELAEALSIEKEQASSLLYSLRGVSAGANLNEGEMQFGVLLKFGSTELISKIIKSKPFESASEKTSAGSTLYVFKTDDENWYRNDFTSMLRTHEYGQKQYYAWFEDQGLLVSGHENYINGVEQVLLGKSEGYNTNQGYQAASANWQRSSSFVSLVDPIALQHDGFKSEHREICEKVFQSFTAEGQPFTLSSVFHERGLLTESVMPLNGDMLPPRELMPENGELTLPANLPLGTIGYMAGRSSKGSMRSQSELMEDYMLRLIKRFDPESYEREMARRENPELEDERQAENGYARSFSSHFTSSYFEQLEANQTIFPSIADEEFDAAEYMVAMLYERPAKIDSSMSKLFSPENFGLLFAMQMSEDQFSGIVDDLSAPDSFFAKLSNDERKQLEENMAEDDGMGDYYKDRLEEHVDFSAKREGNDLLITAGFFGEKFSGKLTYIDGASVLVMGEQKMIDKALATMQGDGDTLSDDAAWQGARDAIDLEGSFELYIDSGEIIYLNTESDRQRKKRYESDMQAPATDLNDFTINESRDEERGDGPFGIDINVIRAEGDDRLVSMMCVSVSMDSNEELTLICRDLNLPYFGAVITAGPIMFVPLMAYSMDDGYEEEMYDAEFSSSYPAKAEAIDGSLPGQPSNPMISEIKRHLEVYFIEFDENAQNLQDLIDSENLRPDSVVRDVHGWYRWEGEITQGRFVGTIHHDIRKGETQSWHFHLDGSVTSDDPELIVPFWAASPVPEVPAKPFRSRDYAEDEE